MAVSSPPDFSPLGTSPAPAIGRPDVSVVIPCLSEEQGIGWVIQRAREGLRSSGLAGEIVVVDNGSEDRTALIAAEHGAKVVVEDQRGYGYAYRRGFTEATGEIVLMADGDATYDLAYLGQFVDALGQGADLVLGSRINGIDPGAMPFLHRFVGNPFFSWLFSAAFSLELSDVCSGMRAFRRSTFPPESFDQGGMEFALEMLVNAAQRQLRVLEIPIDYHRREGISKLRTWRDGWRTLRYIASSKMNAFSEAPLLDRELRTD
jgi:glycosyltransferase involved in cell wall biosynthesis